MGIRENHEKTSAGTGSKPAASGTNTKVALEEQESSVVSLTNALVQCDDHLEEVQNENMGLRARNAALREKVDATATGEHADGSIPAR